MYDDKSQDVLLNDGNLDVERASQPFLGRWYRLISRTNWEKGRIICEWREALVARGAPVTHYSDEAWCERVGGISSQHVGRLRRVYRRFGAVSEEYPGLYWSHFLVALDWNDAEMWLEGAVQSRWSVSQMRRTRWQALGAPADLKSRDEEKLDGELWDDVSPWLDAPPMPLRVATAEVRDPARMADEPEVAGEYVDSELVNETGAAASDEAVGEDAAEDTWARRLASVSQLPDDLADALDALKLAILRHKMCHWEEVSRVDVLRCLAALRELIVKD